MTFFNENVLATLNKHGVTVEEQEINSCINICDEVEAKGILGHKTKKDPENGRPRSIFHSPRRQADRQPGQMYEHWLILSGRKNSEPQDEAANEDEKVKQKDLVTTKIYINLETGEEWFARIRHPKEQSDNAHLVDTFRDQANHELMNAESHTYTRYNWKAGTKGYSLTPYHGKRNLFDLLENPGSSPAILQDVLVQSGDRLQEIHAKGYLHADFKPQNILYKEEDGKIQVVNLETMMSKQVGKEGINQIRGSEKFWHQQWYTESRKRFAEGKPVCYDTSNDVFAYLVMAKLFIEKARDRENDPINKSTFNTMVSRIEGWQKKPMKEMPKLEEVLNYLKDEKPKQTTSMKYFM